MHPEVGVLRELIVLAGVSLAVVLLFQRLRLPALVGFIATGVLIGPGGLGLVGDPALVQTLAEIGVVVLLFTVGLEFSLADLRAMGRRTVVAGALQMTFTLAAVAALLTLAGVRPPQALFVGMMAALSSTAVVLKLLSDRASSRTSWCSPSRCSRRCSGAGAAARAARPCPASRRCSAGW